MVIKGAGAHRRLGGLPGVGKTTIARELARQIGAVHVRIDSIEQAIRDARIIPHHESLTTRAIERPMPLPKITSDWATQRSRIA